MADERDLMDAVDLAANQRGQLTEKQRREARQRYMSISWFGSLVAILLMILGATLALAFNIALEGASPYLVWGATIFVLALSYLPSMLYLFRFVWRRRQTSLDLAAGEISQADGAVNWRSFRHVYAIEFPGHPSWDAAPVSRLPPGPYRFYYLPRSRFVISAQPIAKSAEATELRQVLRKVLRYGDRELELYRAGKLTVTQRAWRGVLAVGASLLIIFDALRIINRLSVPNVTWLSLAIEIAFPILLILGIWKPALDFLYGRVSLAEGLATRTTTGDGRTFHLQVGETNLQVSMWVYQAIVPGRKYRAYFTHFDRQLLALDPDDQPLSPSQTGRFQKTSESR